MSGNSLTTPPGFVAKSGLLFSVYSPKGGCIMYGFVSPQKGGQVNVQRIGWNDWLRGWPAASG